MWKNDRGYQKIGAFLVIIILLLFSLDIVLISSNPVVSELGSEELALKYAPVLHFDPNETTYPVDADYFINESSLFEYELGGPVLINATPTPSSLASINGTNYYLDYRGSDKTSIIDRYIQDRNGLGYDVYYHFDKEGTDYLIQYWFFYVYNSGELNDHEGDWEMAQVVLGPDLSPIYAACSQHESGIKGRLVVRCS